MRIITSIIVTIIAISIIIILITPFWKALIDFVTIPALLTLILGIILAVMGLFVIRSKPKLSESIGRKEFYGVVAALIGWMQIWIINLGGRIDVLSGRIDQIFQLLIK